MLPEDPWRCSRRKGPSWSPLPFPVRYVWKEKTLHLRTMSKSVCIISQGNGRRSLSSRERRHSELSRCAWSSCHSWLSFITVIIQDSSPYLAARPDQVVRKSYLRSARSPRYRIKLQCQKHTERRTTESDIRWKISIQLTNVGLAHARPNYS